MKLANVNKIVYLEDFYSEECFKLNLETLTLQYSDTKYDTNGFCATEACGLKQKTSHRFAIFWNDNNIYFMYDNKLFEASEICLVSLSKQIPFIDKFKLKIKNGTLVVCSRWSKDIDEFAMNDFFYYVSYSYKHKFKNLLSNKTSK